MSRDIRRVLRRVSYEESIRLLGDDGKPLVVGRALNLSPSGIYVRAPSGCEIGSEVTCDLPLPGGARQLRGRVTRTQALPDESTGIGIQFVDLTTGDSSSLHEVLEGSGPRAVAVKVLFEGMRSPVKCHGVVTAEGIRLNTTLPFLRLGSEVKALYDGQDTKIDARGVLTGVRLEPVESDGVPRLGVDVEIESEAPFEASSSWTTSGTSREDASAGGAFTAWTRPPITAAPVEPPVVTDPELVQGEGPSGDITAVVHTRSSSSWKDLAVRFARVPAWGFATAVLAAFAVVYAGIHGFPSGSEANRQAVAAVPEPSPAAGTNAVGTLQPLVVPSTESPPASEARAIASDPTPEAAPAPVAAAAPRAIPAEGDDAVAAARRHGRPHTAKARRLDSSLPFDASTADPDELADANMRGRDVAVEASSLYLEIALPRPASNGKFGVRVTPSWPTTLAITGKSTTGFTVSFGTPAPADAHLDWLLVPVSAR